MSVRRDWSGWRSCLVGGSRPRRRAQAQSVSTGHRLARTTAPDSYVNIHVTMTDTKFTLSRHSGPPGSDARFILRDVGKKPHAFQLGTRRRHWLPERLQRDRQAGAAEDPDPVPRLPRRQGAVLREHAGRSPTSGHEGHLQGRCVPEGLCAERRRLLRLVCAVQRGRDPHRRAAVTVAVTAPAAPR